MEFGSLLPEAMFGTSDVLQLSLVSGRPVELVQHPSTLQPAQRHLHDLPKWFKAFSLFPRVLVDASPDQAQDLLAYQATIIEANNIYFTDVWLTYAQHFCTSLASMPHLYSQRQLDPNLWKLCFTSHWLTIWSHCSLLHMSPAPQCLFRGGLPHAQHAGGSQLATSPAPHHDGRKICRNSTMELARTRPARGPMSVCHAAANTLRRIAPERPLSLPSDVVNPVSMPRLAALLTAHLVVLFRNYAFAGIFNGFSIGHTTSLVSCTQSTNHP